jgi:hypothetical protein
MTCGIFQPKPGVKLALSYFPFNVDLNHPIGNRCRMLEKVLTKFVFVFWASGVCFYVAKFGNAVHVLHAFQKKTQKTRREDIELAQRRYRQIEEA